MGQSHALQMLAAIAMENPGTTDAAALRQARIAVLRQLAPLTKRTAPASVVRAQYRGYRDEVGVAKNSQTETYFQLQVNLRSKRWRGTPFFIEAGKALHHSKVKIKVFFMSIRFYIFYFFDKCISISYTLSRITLHYRISCFNTLLKTIYFIMI